MGDPAASCGRRRRLPIWLSVVLSISAIVAGSALACLLLNVVSVATSEEGSHFRHVEGEYLTTDHPGEVRVYRRALQRDTAYQMVPYLLPPETWGSSDPRRNRPVRAEYVRRNNSLKREFLAILESGAGTAKLKRICGSNCGAETVMYLEAVDGQFTAYLHGRSFDHCTFQRVPHAVLHPGYRAPDGGFELTELEPGDARPIFFRVWLGGRLNVYF